MRCKLLENQVYIGTSGQFRLCCISVEPANVENINTHTIDEWLSSNTVSTARDTFAQGNWPSACQKCQQHEQSGKVSKRQASEDYGPGLTHLDLRFGNSCNLSCNMCSPSSSSTLVYEHQRLLDNGIKSPWGTTPFKILNWYNDDHAKMLANISSLKEVYLTGGEPMMVKGLINFIRQLDSRVSLRFNTNGTILNPELLKEIKRFNYINMSFSIDGVGPVNDYIRWGSNWNTICDNLKICQDAGFDVNISPTIQIMNELYMPQLIDWASAQGIKVFNNYLLNPAFLNTANAVWNTDNEILQQTFINHVTTLDKSRGCSIRDYLPEVADAYAIYKNNRK